MQKKNYRKDVTQSIIDKKLLSQIYTDTSIGYWYQ